MTNVADIQGADPRRAVERATEQERAGPPERRYAEHGRLTIAVLLASEPGNAAAYREGHRRREQAEREDGAHVSPSGGDGLLVERRVSSARK